MMMTVRSAIGVVQPGLQLHAVHAGHLDVDAARYRTRPAGWSPALRARSHRPGRVALAGKPLAQRIAHHQFVVDDQDSSLGLHRRCGSTAVAIGSSRSPRGGTPPLAPHFHAPAATAAVTGSATTKFRSFARRGAHRDLARVLLHDAVRHGQSQAGAVLVLLGGEERIEDARQHVRRNAAPGVLDPHRAPAPVSGSKAVPPPGRRPWAWPPRRSPSAPAPPAGSGWRRTRTGGRPAARFSASSMFCISSLCFTSRMARLDDGVQIVGLAHGWALPREGQQVLHQVAAALALALDGLQLLGHLVAVRRTRASAARAAPAARRSECRRAGC